MKCNYSTMEWYCCKEMGHKGDHESYPLLPFITQIPKREKPKKEGK